MISVEKSKLANSFLVLSLVSISPIFPFFGLKGIFFYILFISLYLILNFEQIIFRKIELVIIFFFSFLSAIGALLLSDLNVFFSSIMFTMTLMVVSSMSEKNRKNTIDLMSIFLQIILVMAIISFIYTLLGGEPIFSITNPDGRENHFLLTSFSNSFWSGFSRPSGIFDEPGTLSFFVCSVCALRQLFSLEEKKTIYLLLMGLITFSLAHIIFSFFLFFSFSKKIFFLKRLLFLIVIMTSAIIVSGNFSIFYNVFLIRFEIEEGLRFLGDNRSENFINALYLLINYPLSIFYGIEEYIPSESDYYIQVFGKYGEIGGNPLNLLLTSGIFIWSIYAILVLTLMSSFHLKSKFWAAFAFALLLLQRDYIFVIGYSLLTSLIFIKVLNSFKFIENAK